MGDRVEIGETFMEEAARMTAYGLAKLVHGQHRGRPVQREIIALGGVTLVVGATANNFGGVRIATFPNRNLMLLGFKLDILGTLPDALVGTNLTMSLGSAVAAATPLATTAIDYMAAKTGTGAAQAFGMQGVTIGQTTAGLKGLAAGTTNYLFLNAAITTTPAATLTIDDGMVEVFYIDLDKVA
jgi:hypothetical protein